MAKPTEQEIEQLNEVQERISDLRLSQEYLSHKNLVRFLRARNGNLDQVEDMIRKNVSWSETNEVESALEWDFNSDFKKNFPWEVVGFDDKGGPIAVIPMGRWNAGAAAGKRDEFVRLGIQNFETVWTLMKIRSKDKEAIPQSTVIVDLEGLGWRQYTSVDALQGTLTLLKYFEANYPDTLRLGIIVNAPSIFSMFWKLIKPIMSDVTHKKLQFLGHDKTQWGRAIAEVAELDQIPEKYGGKLSDGKVISTEKISMLKHDCTNSNEIYAL